MTNEYPLPLRDLKVFCLHVIEYDTRLETMTNISRDTFVKVVAENQEQAKDKAYEAVPWKNIPNEYVTRTIVIESEEPFEYIGGDL